MIRNVLTLTALVVLSGVSLEAAWTAIAQSAAPSMPLRHEAMLEWLTTADGKTAPLASKRVLVHQLEQDFRQGYDWSTDYEALKPAEQKRFAANFIELTRVLLVDKIDAYFTRPPKKRERYLEAELTDLLSWKVPVFDRSVPSPRGGFVADLAKNADRWLAEMTPRERKRAEEFLAQVKTLVFSRPFKNWLPR
jgi:hypothetical protein